MDSRNSQHDFRFSIPAYAFINAQVIQKARNSKDFKKAVMSVISSGHYENQGLTEYEIQNHAYVVSLLYCLIVVPKELWGKKKKSIIYSQIEETNTIELFNINSTVPKDKSAFSLIHHLRNSVSHADFSVDSHMSFIFRDNNTEWSASIEINDLMIFLSKVGSILANHGLSHR